MRQGNQIKPLEIIYEDNHLLVVNKPAGLLTQGDFRQEDNLLLKAKRYIKEKYKKPGNVYLGLVHRLDRVTSGVVVLARTSKAASRLSQAFREKKIKKFYLAIVEGKISKNKEKLEHFIYWNPQKHRIQASSSPFYKGQKACLSFQVIKKRDQQTLLLIEPYTGRKHQIRAQLSAIGHPIWGDIRYSAHTSLLKENAILLHAFAIFLRHPTLKKFFTFQAPLPYFWPLWAKKIIKSTTYPILDL